MRYLFCWISVLAFASICRGQSKSINVDPNGSGDFRTIQEAIAAAPKNSAQKTVIHIAPGTYAGPFIVPKSKPNITIIGDDPLTTILTWDRNVRDPIPKGDDGFNPGFQVQADDFIAWRLTIENTSGD